MLDIKGAVAVITGGGSGIGLALAKYWVEKGGKVVLGDVSGEALDKARSEIEAMGGEVAVVTGNLVAPFAGVIKDGMMVATDRETGKVSRKMSLQDFQFVIDINLTGVFLTIRECAERMINNSCRGLICLVSSTGSLGTAGQINYSSTKAAMSVMPKVLTGEFFRRGFSDMIRVVAVAPGYVGTDMVKGMNQDALDKILGNVPIKRLIEPEEVASLVCELYRNEAMAGDTYFIHGGLRMSSKG
jgi:3-oxoacyl-[acyl-carrier protein] reductase